jgi:hypothetical protein
MSPVAQADVPGVLKATPALLGQLELLEDLERRIARLRERQQELEQQRDEARAQAAKRVGFGSWTVGDFAVRRTLVEPGPSIDAWQAIEDGAVARAVLEPYMRPRRPFERWTLKRRRRKRVSA